MVRTINCTCGKSYPFNPDKHTRHQTIYCPFCKVPIPNPEYKLSRLNIFRTFIEKIQTWNQKREALKFLDRYCRTTPVLDHKNRIIRWNYSFSLSKWMDGRRPYVSEYDIKRAIGLTATKEAIQQEIKWLHSLGVKIPEYIIKKENR